MYRQWEGYCHSWVIKCSALLRDYRVYVGQGGVLEWAAEIMAVNEIYKISVSHSFVTDFEIILLPDVTAGEILL